MKSAVNLDTQTVIDIEFQAASIDILDSHSGILERRDDVDVFRFSALTGANITIETLLSDYSNLTAQLDVYRASDMSLVAGSRRE